ncbi:glycoside hydrolase family 140 protein [Galbibacter sp.]|uniref:glycoside hydrolase family 140 protein n=1 Tax=Galbibacter sp. TaxID=2918471 RepID=UPI003A941289
MKMKTFLINSSFALLASCLLGCKQNNKKTTESENTVISAPDTGLSRLEISENHRYFVHENGDPFFWLGDTGWLMFNRLDRNEIKAYIEDRESKGFNVIQAMVLHSLDAVNVYKDTALVAQNVSKPIATEGAKVSDSAQYDFWDHIDYAVKTAEEHGIYMALVPVWGNNVKDGKVTAEQGKAYAKFLAQRYKDTKNIIWLNGGDTFGNEYTDVWQAIGETLDQYNPQTLITFHPRGRHDSSDWFHNENWLDFNMFQSGHRRYDQDDTDRAYGEDNWRFVQADYALKPTKPTLDGEPSYEGIPQGLHDTLQPFWKAKDVRRYAYWSVFQGAAGFTYGHSAVMQMHPEGPETGAYGNKMPWDVALDDPGAKQMQHLKKLLTSYPFLSGQPDSTLVINQGERYQYMPATVGQGYVMVYTYDGRTIEIKADALAFDSFTASWYNPRNGEKSALELSDKKGDRYSFQPPGEQADGNDWVLIIEAK